MTSTTQNNPNPVRVLNSTVHVVSTVEACRNFVRQIRDDCRESPVIGLDCEWVSVFGERRKVALLQLASQSGLCILVRLFKMNSIPSELKELLADQHVFKVGIEVLYDGEKLLRDYGIEMKGALDLRFMARMLRIPGPYSLAGLAETVVDITLNKDSRLSASNWETEQLSPLQIEYAAKDAIVALDIFRSLKKDIYWSSLDQYRDVPFKRRF